MITDTRLTDEQIDRQDDDYNLLCMHAEGENVLSVTVSLDLIMGLNASKFFESCENVMKP